MQINWCGNQKPLNRVKFYSPALAQPPCNGSASDHILVIVLLYQFDNPPFHVPQVT